MKASRSRKYKYEEYFAILKIIQAYFKKKNARICENLFLTFPAHFK